MNLPPIVSQEEWRAARDDLLAKEKEHTRAGDRLAAARRRLPRVEIANDYVFDGPDGPVTLGDLFDGRRQLVLYNYMFEPGGTPCSGCAMFTDNVGHLAHLHARDTSLALVSRAPFGEIEEFRRRMGWPIPWYSSAGTTWNDDIGAGGGFALNVLLRDGGRIFRTYEMRSRGVEALGSIWTFLDLTPLGRQETWEDSPEGYPQTAPYGWWRLHDEYDGTRAGR